MLMPETTVNKNDFATGRENKIGLTWQGSDVKTVPIAKLVHNAPHLHFRLHSLAADLPHVLAARLRSKLIHSSCSFALLGYLNTF